MSRYDDLRRMREARFATKPVTEKPKPVTENVTLNTPVTVITPVPKGRPRGRPSTGNALSGAERTRRYRARLREARQ